LLVVQCRPIKSKNVILVGDVNIDIKPNSIDRHCVSYLNLSAELGLLAGHRHPTRLRNCLDHVMIKTSFDAPIFALASSITDRGLIVLNLRVTRPMNNKAKSYRQTDIDSAFKYLKTIYFSFINVSTNADASATLFVDKLSHAIFLI
jgi:hypothetical protein